MVRGRGSKWMRTAQPHIDRSARGCTAARDGLTLRSYAHRWPARRLMQGMLPEVEPICAGDCPATGLPRP